MKIIEVVVIFPYKWNLEFLSSSASVEKKKPPDQMKNGLMLILYFLESI